jgi:hypothetical protein
MMRSREIESNNVRQIFLVMFTGINIAFCTNIRIYDPRHHCIWVINIYDNSATYIPSINKIYRCALTKKYTITRMTQDKVPY